MYVSPVLSVNTCRPGYEATHQVAQQNCITSPLEEEIHHLGNTTVQERYRKGDHIINVRDLVACGSLRALPRNFPAGQLATVPVGVGGGGVGSSLHATVVQTLPASHCHVAENKDCYHRQERVGKAGSAGEECVRVCVCVGGGGGGGGWSLCALIDNQYADT